MGLAGGLPSGRSVLHGYERLSAGDALFLDAESDRNAMQIGVCLVFEGKPVSGSQRMAPDPDALIGQLEARLGSFARYRQRLARTPIEGRFVWVADPDFDSRRHLRYARLPAGSDESALRQRCAEFLREPLEPAHPLWMILVVEGFSSEHFAVVVKAHHCLADGIAGIDLLRALLTLEAGEPSGAVRSAPPTESAPTSAKLLVADAVDRWSGVVDLARRVRTASRHPDALVDGAIRHALGFLAVWESARRPTHPIVLDAAESPERTIDWIASELSRVREIQKRRGGTINDIVVATLAIALGRFLEARGIAREELASMTVRVAIPVNMRAPRGGREAGNHISMIFSALPIAELDPLVALDKTRAALAAAKASHVSEALDLVLDLAEWTPRPLTRALTRLAMTRLHPANLVVTNVPGPAQTLELLGAPLRRAYPIVPLMPGQALTVAVLSYAGRLFWAFHADPDAFPDLETWSKEVQRAFEDLHEAAMCR